MPWQRDGKLNELSNSDIGSHYHQASGSAATAVTGRFGSRNPATGQIDETVYTAGPRGFRPQGPNVHRRLDLSQVPGPRGTPDDPLGDPLEDPSYEFQVRTGEYQKAEAKDATGRVRGQYSFTDDVGEKHIVQYSGGAGTGFEVTNAVPDSPPSIGYTLPLYKTDLKARGRIAIQRGPEGTGTYKFIAATPDQRRSESTGPDGITRGSYSYLDDKGVQRTVQYVAGAGIGYRIVSNTVGTNTHLLPAPALPDFSIPSVTSNALPPIPPGPPDPPQIPGFVVTPTPSSAIPPFDTSLARPFSLPDDVSSSSSAAVDDRGGKEYDFKNIQGLTPPQFAPIPPPPFDASQVLPSSPPFGVEQHWYAPGGVQPFSRLKGRVLSLDLPRATRAPSPGEALRQEVVPQPQTTPDFGHHAVQQHQQQQHPQFEENVHKRTEEHVTRCRKRLQEFICAVARAKKHAKRRSQSTDATN